MVTERFLDESDHLLLHDSLRHDEYHQGTTLDFFTEPGTLTVVYGDHAGAVLFCRASVTLRLDIQYLDNNDAKRNMRVMLEGFPDLVERARASGYKEIVFQSDNPLLRRFCVKRLGFYESSGELRRVL